MKAKQPSPKRAKNIDSDNIRARTEALLSDDTAGPSLVATGNPHSPAANRNKSVKGRHKHDNVSVKLVRKKQRDPNHHENLSRTRTRQRHSQSRCRNMTAKTRSAARRSTCLETVQRRKTIKSKLFWKLQLWRQFSRIPRTSNHHPSKLQNDKRQHKQQMPSKIDAEGTARSLSRLVRSLQLCSSSSDSSPSPPAPDSQTRLRRSVRTHRTRVYGNQLKLYQALRSIKKFKQSTPKLDQTASGASGVKGVTYQKMNRKRCLPAAQSPPAIQSSLKKTSRRLWRRQLDSSGSDSPMSEGSANATPVWSSSRPSSRPTDRIASDTLTSMEAAPPSVVGQGQSVIPPDEEGGPRTLCRAWHEKHDVTRVTVTHLKEQLSLVEANCKLTDFNFIDISSSEPSGSLQNQSRRPSLPVVCKCKKKLVKHLRSTIIKYNIQLKNPNYHVVKEKQQTGKSQVIKVLGPCPHCTMSPNPALMDIQRPADSNMGNKHACQKSSYNPSQMETRSEAHSQARDTSLLPKRSEKCPASKTTLIYFKHQTSASSKTITPTTGENYTPKIPTPFRKPDTPRPKSDLESLKWKNVLERRTESTNLGAEIMSGQGRSSKKSSFQPSSSATNAELSSPVFEKLAALFPEQGYESSDHAPPLGSFAQEPLHSGRPALSYEALCNMEQRRDGRGEDTEGQDPAGASLTPNTPTLNDIRAAVQSQMVEPQQLGTPHRPPEPRSLL